MGLKLCFHGQLKHCKKLAFPHANSDNNEIYFELFKLTRNGSNLYSCSLA